MGKSTKQRVKNSLVIAMTIDAYIQYTINENMKSNIYFVMKLDICLQLKALTLFKCNSQ